MKKLRLFDLAWPIFVETALFMLLGFVDVFILSGYNDLAASSVNTAGQAVSIVTLVFTVISGASAVLISQYLGADKKLEASRIAALSIVLNLVSGIIVSVLFTIFSDEILKGIGADGDVLKFSSQYLEIVGSTIFIQAYMSAVSVIIRNHGMTKLTMYITVGINILNAGLDYIFVQGLFGAPALGVAGAAGATVFSRLIGAVIMSAALFTRVEKPSVFKLLRPFPFSGHHVGRRPGDKALVGQLFPLVFQEASVLLQLLGQAGPIMSARDIWKRHIRTDSGLISMRSDAW